jgi:hypothetical protein
MRVEITQETDPDDSTLEVPWSDPSDPGHCYIDLKGNPSAADSLEECKRYSALGGLLRQANAVHSPFVTAKCDVWATEELTEEERDFHLPHKVGSYVDLLIDGPELNASLETNLRLAQSIAVHLGSVRLSAELEICARRCLFHREERWGYYLTVFTHAYGATPQTAEQEWNLATDALTKALGEAARLFRPKVHAERA